MPKDNVVPATQVWAMLVSVLLGLRPSAHVWWGADRERETWAQHQDRPSVQAVQSGLIACESSDEAEARQTCKSVDEEVNRKLGQCENLPNYKSFPRDTCVWEDDVRVRGSKLERANCESQRERESSEESQNPRKLHPCAVRRHSAKE